MTTSDLKLMKDKIRRRAYVQVEPDSIRDAAVISDKVKRSSCFGAAVSVLVIVAGIVAVIA